ncbi:MAG: hypothetical protein MIN69_04195 [Methylorubrum extorquens]|jgi:hypothetical protein|uniref:hypothetical protein n=1 Tax=Methylorubrum extorquens TaxID=408 RepID=UPI002FEE2793
MKTLMMAAAVGLSLFASAGTASADPWKDESGHGRWGRHEGRGHGWGHHHRPRFGHGYGRPRGYGYYSGHREYRGARYGGYRGYPY